MWVFAPLLSVALGAGSLGCANEVADAPVTAHVSDATSQPDIYGGSKDDDGQAVTGVVALRVGTGTTFELCSGTLIAPNVVLTARHCVTKNVSTSVSCDENGNSANGKHVESDADPTTIGIYTGATPNFAGPPVTAARAVVSPNGPYLCDSDIALVVLASPITNVAPLAVRVHASARKGEMIRSVGYGQNDQSSPIGTRFRKEDVEVLAQGKAVSPSKTPLGLHEFEVGKSICQGDSGGPAISQETGAVIGVVSRGGGCDDDFGHIYTTTAGFENMFADAFDLAGGGPKDESGDTGTQTSSLTSAETTAPASGGATGGGCAVGASPRGASAGGAGLAWLALALAALGGRRRVR